jgi:hypothetical protein
VVPPSTGETRRHHGTFYRTAHSPQAAAMVARNLGPVALGNESWEARKIPGMTHPARGRGPGAPP